MLRIIASAAALSVVLLATQIASRAADPYEIYAILPLTGQAANIGKVSLEGLEGAERTINASGGITGRPVKFIAMDDQSNTQQDVQLANTIIAKKVPVILGSAIVAGCNAILPLVSNGPVLYCLSPALHPDPGSYVFSVNVAASDTIAVGIRYARLRGWKRIATMNGTDATGQDADKAIADAVALPENRGVTVVDTEHFNLTDLSVAAQIARIRAAQPDLLIVWSSGTATGTVFRALKDAGYHVPVITSSANGTYSQMAQFAQILPEDLYFAGIPSQERDQISDPATKRAVDAYFAAFKPMNIKPDLQVSGYDPALLVADALRKLGLGATPAQLRDYIANLRGWVGANGPYDFVASPQRGLSMNSASMVRWVSAKNTWEGVSKPGGVPLGGK